MTQVDRLTDRTQVYRQLLVLARQAAHHSYSPNSNYPVGSALLCRDGSIFTGCNVENINMGSAICAERTALVKAVSEGHRAFEAIATVSKVPDCWPCGVCRQFMLEFGDGLVVVVEGPQSEVKTALLGDLAPECPRPGKPAPDR